jgi:hypothetical protein
VKASSVLGLASIGAFAGAVCVGSLLPFAQVSAQTADPTVFHSNGGLTMRWHLQAGSYAAVEQTLFWNLAATTTPGSGYDPDKAWMEFYVKPGLSFERTLAGGGTLYGKLSAVASATRGTGSPI